MDCNMLVFISTFVSPHTLPLGIELLQYYKKVVFVNTMELTQERRNLGYEVSDPRVEIYSYSNEPNECQRMIDQAETVIMAGTNFRLVSCRIRLGKSVFLMHERLFKKGVLKLFDPRTWQIARNCCSVRNKPVYLLSIGEFAARDFRFLGFNKNNIYRFGYFTDANNYDASHLKKENDRYEVLWVGRFVGFKRPIMALKAYEKMGDRFSLTMVGDGPMLNEAQVYAKKHRIRVRFLGSLSADEVKEIMRHSDILLSTSHRGEGWGVVINEGMGCYCAVVSARAVGCVGSLITDDNAVLYKTYSVRDLRRALNEAAQKRKPLGQCAHDTVMNHFNARQAAFCFATLAQQGKTQSEGICSNVFGRRKHQ